MGTYVHHEVWAPDWLENFHCLMRDCPKTCCQNWNIDVDQAHAEKLLMLADPAFAPQIQAMLRRIVVRKKGSPDRQTQYRFDLLSQPGKHCPLLDGFGECSLQKRYGEDVLCHTCYFYPRLFWQIDERWTFTTGLACPETARLAIMREDPVRLIRFDAETDPDAEWLETDQISDDGLRNLLLQREELVSRLVRILQDRGLPIVERLETVCYDLGDRDARITPVPDVEEMARLSGLFDCGCEGREKASECSRDLFRTLAGGDRGYFRILTEAYRRNYEENYLPFITEHPTYEENFLVHTVFSDLLKQFGRYRCESLSAGEVLKHESRLLQASFALFRLQQCAAPGPMTGERFLQNVIAADDSFFHYPQWMHSVIG